MQWRKYIALAIIVLLPLCAAADPMYSDAYGDALTMFFVAAASYALFGLFLLLYFISRRLQKNYLFSKLLAYLCLLAVAGNYILTISLVRSPHFDGWVVILLHLAFCSWVAVLSVRQLRYDP